MTLPDDLTTTATSSTSNLVSRRTVVRGAAAAAWIVPAVTLATATPGFAATCSSNLSLTTTANYLNYTNAGTADPTRMDITASVTNSGPAAANGVQIQLRIPKVANNAAHETPGYAVAPGIVTAASVNAGGISTGTWSDGGDHWLLVLTLDSAIPNGQTRTITGLRIGFRDGGTNVVGTLTGFTTAHAPYRRWAGNAFTMNNTVTATNVGCGAVSGPAIVAATPNSSFNGDGAEIEWHAVIPGAMRARLDEVWNSGRSSIGKVTLRVEIEKRTSGRLSDGFQAAPQYPSDTITHATKWNFISTNAGGGNGSNSDPRWYWIFESKLAGWAPSTGSGGPSTDLDGPADRWAFEARFVANSANILETVNPGIRGFQFSAPHATTKWVDSVGNVNW